MELIQGSETSANYNLTPGKYPEENIQYSNHGESLKSRRLTFHSKKISNRRMTAPAHADSTTIHSGTISGFSGASVRTTSVTTSFVRRVT